MAGRTSTRTKPRTASPAVHLLEDAARTRTPLVVDREQGVIKHVKVLGWDSVNRRHYTRDCGRRAVERGVYEGAKCYWNHPRRGEEHLPRDAGDAIGVFRGVVLEEDGIYADLHFFKADVRAQKLCEDCERGIGFYGMSHHLRPGEYRAQDDPAGDGSVVITEILSVFSVDCVTDSASTSTLWESRTVKIKLAALFEGLASNRKLPKATRKALLEMDDGMVPDVEVEEPAAEADPAASLKDGFKAAAQGLFDAALDGDGDSLKKLVKLIKAHVKLAGGEGGDDLEEEEGDEEEGAQEAKGKRARKPARGAPGLTESDARGLCEFAGVQASPAVLGLMTGKTLTEARAVLELAKGQKAPAQDAGSLPRSSGPVATPPVPPPAKGVQESRQQPADPDQARALRVAAWRNGR